VLLYPVEPRQVDNAVAWLEGHRQGDVYVPDEFLPLVAARERFSAGPA
jgi:hypothetical protein